MVYTGDFEYLVNKLHYEIQIFGTYYFKTLNTDSVIFIMVKDRTIEYSGPKAKILLKELKNKVKKAA